MEMRHNKQLSFSPHPRSNCCVASQNKCVYPNVAAASLRPPATQPWKLKLLAVFWGGILFLVFFVFLLHLHSFSLTLNTPLTRDPTHFPRACSPPLLAAPPVSSRDPRLLPFVHTCSRRSGRASPGVHCAALRAEHHFCSPLCTF